MNFFKAKTSWTNIEFVPLKLCVASAYVLIGAYFHDFFQTYYLPVFLLFIITVTWAMYLWISKMKKKDQ